HDVPLTHISDDSTHGVLAFLLLFVFRLFPRLFPGTAQTAGAAGQVLLARAADREGAVGNVPGDHGARRRAGVRADPHRRDEHGSLPMNARAPISVGLLRTPS